MDTEKYTDTEETGQIQEISRRIQEEADSEVRNIIQQAQKKAEEILNAGQQQAASERAKKLADLEIAIKQMKERMFSSLNLEKRRIELKEKDKLIRDILASVSNKAKSFRTSEEYQNFLKESILEGILVLDKREVRVIYSFLDEAIFTEFFLRILSDLVILFGNILVILLEGMVVGIQSLRLNYYEFFSKFFVPGKQEFKPLTTKPFNKQQFVE